MAFTSFVLAPLPFGMYRILSSLLLIDAAHLSNMTAETDFLKEQQQQFIKRLLYVLLDAVRMRFAD